MTMTSFSISVAEIMIIAISYYCYQRYISLSISKTPGQTKPKSGHKSTPSSIIPLHQTEILLLLHKRDIPVLSLHSEISGINMLEKNQQTIWKQRFRYMFGLWVMLLCLSLYFLFFLFLCLCFLLLFSVNISFMDLICYQPVSLPNLNYLLLSICVYSMSKSLEICKNVNIFKKERTSPYNDNSVL